MENHAELEENMELLQSKTGTLAKLREHVEETGEGRTEMWLQNVIDKEYEVDDLEYEFKELIKKGSDHSDSNARLELNSRVIERLQQVNDLIQSVGVSSYSTKVLMRELAFEKLKRYTFDDLVKFTSNFATEIGLSAFGMVYSGQLSNGVKLAVKVFMILEVHREYDFFDVEVCIMGNIDHQNLIQLYGFCLEDDKKALVYEYMDYGSLDLILYYNSIEIEWDKLYAIAIEMAKALAYLHDKQIIHHDFKAANVLLDSNHRPKLKNFGLATQMGRNQSDITLTRVKGTPAYMAPEMCLLYSKVTSKSDVYSFGLLLFEILGRRKNRLENDWFPETIVDQFINKKIMEVIASCGIEEKDRKKATILLMVAIWCIQYTPEARPSISTVAVVLERELFVNLPPDPFESSNNISVMKPDMNHSDVSSFSMDVPQKYKSADEEQSQKGGNASSSSNESLVCDLSLEKQTRYSYFELSKISAGFGNKIGGGAYADVFKGQFSNGVEVAIKVLKSNDVVEQTFLAEVRTMGNTKHQNLVELIGFCLEDTYMALVYEYMKMGSLDTILYNKPPSIEWEKLYSIAIGTARALAHLHHGCEPHIIHFDVKPANILLDSDHSPKLTDFGLAAINNNEASHVTMTKAKGTPGFGAPEVWMPFEHATSKCDVFSFGMLLFEILGTARNSQKAKWFPRYVWEKFKNGKLNDVITERGFKEKDRKKATTLSMVALWCIQHSPKTRPTMIAVLEVLEKEISVNKPPNPFLSSDSVYLMQPELNL